MKRVESMALLLLYSAPVISRFKYNRFVSFIHKTLIKYISTAVKLYIV